MLNTFKLFESYLNEARTPEWTLEKNPEIRSLSGEYLTLDTVKAIFDADPTRNKVYVNWMLRCYKRSDHGVFMEDLYRMHDALELYDRIKRNLPEEERNIFNIPNLIALEGAVAVVDENPELTMSRRQLKGDASVDGEYDVIYENGIYSIIIPNTHRAACYWGSSTRWCTSYDSNPAYFNEYTKAGPLFIIYDRFRERPYLQFHFERSHFMDVNDIPIDLEDFYNKNPDIRDAILEYTTLRVNRVNSISGLLTAIRQCNIPAVIMQLDNGAEEFIAEYRGNDGQTVLHMAANTSDPYQMFSLIVSRIQIRILREIAPVMTMDKHETVAMSLAKSNGINQELSNSDKITMVRAVEDSLKKCIRYGLNIEAPGNRGRTPFMVSCLNDNWEFAKILMNCGANTSVIDSEGKNLLHLLAYKKTKVPSDLENINMIIPDNINAADNYGKTALHYAVFNDESSSAEEFIRHILSLGADPNIEDQDGNTPMHALAARKQLIGILPDIVSFGGDLNKRRDIDGKSPIDVAKAVSNKVFLKKVKELISKGAVNTRE